MIEFNAMLPSVVMLLQLVVTFSLIGVIWFVQVVHSPLFSKVGHDNFAKYEELRQGLTRLVVAPLMLVEAFTALAMVWVRPPGVSQGTAIIGTVLVALLWCSTFFWQVPLHQRLAASFDESVHQKLVGSNWLRTAGWSARGLLVSWMYLQAG